MLLGGFVEIREKFLLQFCSKLYINELRKHNCQISMTQDGNPYDNAVAERVNGILKDEFYCDEPFENYDTTLAYVTQAIMLYNTRRPHLSCSMLKPVQMHRQHALPVKQWYKNLSTVVERSLINGQPISGRLTKTENLKKMLTIFVKQIGMMNLWYISQAAGLLKEKTRWLK